MKQKYLFLESEGNRWFERNRDALVKASEADPVAAAINCLKLKPKRVLEVGCSNGWRLAWLRDTLGCEVMGVEPSMQAALDAATRRVPVIQATASTLVVSESFDLVIYGFCLYLTDPDDWLTIAAEGDRALNDGGHLIIHDFGDCYASMPLFAESYKHREGIRSYHYDFSKLWLGNPRYRRIAHNLVHHGEGQVDAVSVLKKKSIKEMLQS